MLPVRGPQWEPSRPSSPQMGNVTWRAVRVQQARIKSVHPPLRQIGHGSTDRGSISDSQADSAGSIPVTRSKCEKCCSTSESDCISQAGQRSFGSENGTRAITRALSHLGECPWRLSVPKLTVRLQFPSPEHLTFSSNGFPKPAQRFARDEEAAG